MYIFCYSIIRIKVLGIVLKGRNFQFLFKTLTSFINFSLFKIKYQCTKNQRSGRWPHQQRLPQLKVVTQFNPTAISVNFPQRAMRALHMASPQITVELQNISLCFSNPVSSCIEPRLVIAVPFIHMFGTRIINVIKPRIIG